MARISGVNIPTAKRLVIALTYIHGIGPAVARSICTAVGVDPSLRGQGAGRALMAHAEAHAVAEGCHSAWLDTFQARGFYEAFGYQVFGTLEDYPPGQRRSFLRKRLIASAT